MVSFANPEEGLNYQHPEPDYPAPEALKSENELKEGILNFVPENVRAVLCVSVMLKSVRLIQSIHFNHNLKRL
jgi:acyl-CoA thioesterase